jgi:hypothetical protein
MAYNTSKEERDALIDRLDEMEHRLMGNCFNQSDILTLIKINKELVHKAFENDIAQERAEKMHDQIMSEMSHWDFEG